MLRPSPLKELRTVLFAGSHAVLRPVQKLRRTAEMVLSKFERSLLETSDWVALAQAAACPGALAARFASSACFRLAARDAKAIPAKRA
jgi:hypothetical protein